MFKKLKKLVIFLKGEDNHKLRRLIEKIYIHFLWVYFSFKANKGTRVLDEDWDYLVILDACRYDTFKEVNDIKGKLEKRISLGSGTKEWIVNNFKEYYGDIVYVSGNPFISNYELKHTNRISGWVGTKHFFKVEDVWNYGWDPGFGTTLPNKVTNAALKMRKKYPNKRMIIHYMQPHGPWAGETKLSAKEVNKKIKGGGFDNFLPAMHYFWDKVKFENFDIEKIKQAYKDNLKLVLREVKRLIRGLDGKIVISADHGTSFGEGFIYAHPLFIHTKELVEVPWLIIEKDKRRIKYQKIDERKNIRRKIRELRKLKNL